jgi:fructose-1,6-bisphosphatase/inositol monophosphatase family enzyme
MGKINNYGPMSQHAVGIILKECVRRAIEFIRNERYVFEVNSKEGYSGDWDDVQTSADRGAQCIYMKTLKECFPDAGIIAEEDCLHCDPENDCDIYFTVDPMDGTKAFVRRQSHGVGTMIAMIKGDKIISAFVGDINTREIYGYRPDSDRVHRISEFNTSEVLNRDLDIEAKPLSEQCILLRKSENDYSKSAQSIMDKSFKKALVDGASIGTWMARLWKGEVAAALIDPTFETPWDVNPIYGISHALGYKFLKRSVNEIGVWNIIDPKPVMETRESSDEILVVHENDLYDLVSGLGELKII